MIDIRDNLPTNVQFFHFMRSNVDIIERATSTLAVRHDRSLTIFYNGIIIPHDRSISSDGMNIMAAASSTTKDELLTSSNDNVPLAGMMISIPRYEAMIAFLIIRINDSHFD